MLLHGPVLLIALRVRYWEAYAIPLGPAFSSHLPGYCVAVHPGVTIAHFFRESRNNYEVMMWQLLTISFV